MKWPLFSILAAVCSFAFSGMAEAQQTARSAAAVQPGKGVVVLRQYLEVDHYTNPDINQFSYESILGYGVTRNFTVMAHLPLVYRDFQDASAANAPTSDGEVGVRDLKVMGQYRFWQSDTRGIGTQRAVVFAGLELPSGDDGFSSDSVDPYVGLAYTRIVGRHGFNIAGQYQWNNGSRDEPVTFGDLEADAVRLDTGYLYRLAPEAYTLETRSSWYLTTELLGRYETNGDAEVLFAPGVMYEAMTWAVGASVAFPVWQDLEERPELEASVLVELRFLF